MTSTSSPPTTFSTRLPGLQRVAAEEEECGSERVRVGCGEEARGPNHCGVEKVVAGAARRWRPRESQSSSRPCLLLLWFPPPCRWGQQREGTWWRRCGGRQGMQLIASRIRARPHDCHRAHPGPTPPSSPPPSSSPRSSSSPRRRSLSSSPPLQFLTLSPVQLLPPPPPRSSLSRSPSISFRRRSSPQPRITATTPDADAGGEREYDRIHTLLPCPGRCTPACERCWRHYSAPDNAHHPHAGWALGSTGDGLIWSNTLSLIFNYFFQLAQLVLS
jgi:hypothetical protein